MKTKNYVQCSLALRLGPQQDRWTTSWIPERYAVKGKFLKLKDRESGEWEDGWEVVECWTKQRAELVEARERSFLHQRSVSDV